MLTDYHCHILPGLDDGAESVEMSLEMLEVMKSYGVERIVATSHFYAHRERSVERFLEKRQQAYEKLMAAAPPIKNIILGAEVAIEKDLSEIKNIEKLAIQGTDLILLEFPYKEFSNWMVEEIENVAATFGLTPIVAHVHRYFPFYTKSDYEKVLQADAVFQINAEAFGTFKESGLVKKLIKNEFSLVFGSDAHNVSDRKPNLNIAVKKLAKYEGILDKSNSLIDRHFIK